ncbi:MAG: hypothetical protein PHD05_09390 [Sphaerochaetaceae bacterium]|nr:hypothetical protein [Sphaerochaetaceae bacterium]
MNKVYTATTVVLLIAIMLLAGNFFVNSKMSPTGYFTATPTGAADVNVTVSQAVSVLVTTGSALNLGSLYPSDFNSTASGAGIILENNGSVDVNVTANMPTLFTSTNLPAGAVAAVSCKSADSETGSATTLQATYVNCYGGNTPVLVGGLKYANATDTVRVDINVVVPTDESIGLKQGIVTFTASAS